MLGVLVTIFVFHMIIVENESVVKGIKEGEKVVI